MSKIFLGISPFYFHGAEGHYGRVHPALLEGIEAIEDSNGTLHQYFGAEGFPQMKNSMSMVSKSFKNPRGSIHFAEVKGLAKFIEAACTDKESYIYVYEGTFPFLLSLKLAQAKGVKVNAVINLHQVEVFKSILKDQLVRAAHRKIVRNCLKTPGTILITAESRLSAKMLSSDLNYELDVFPIFSTFSSTLNSTKGERPNLVLLSGEFNEELIIKDLTGIGISGSESIIIDARINDLATSDFINYLSENDFQVIGQRVSEETYKSLFDSVSTVWFLYRLPVNILGSSGRLMDAIGFGLDIVVPSNSALEDFALESKANVFLIDLDTYAIKKIDETDKSASENELIDAYDTSFAISELFRMWDRNLQMQKSRRVTGMRKISKKRYLLSYSTIYFEWALLQISLLIARVRIKLRRTIFEDHHWR